MGKNLRSSDYIKSLLVQMFVNKKFPVNRNKKDDESFIEFEKKFNKKYIID